MEPIKIVFVCTANIARSPYAEQRTWHLTGSQVIEATSAGIPGHPGQQMDNLMAEQLIKRGGHMTTHTSRRLDSLIVTDADLLLTMELSHHLQVLNEWPGAAGKVFGLEQFADAVERHAARPTNFDRPRQGLIADIGIHALPNSMTLDVADPHRRGRRAARKCAAQIDRALERILPGLGRLVEPA